jgi:AbrB family looped-hinge helix DNA binding protein
MSKQHPEGKRFYGTITVSERGQVVIPAEARRDFHIETGDKLFVMGDLDKGLWIIKASALLEKMPELFSILTGEQPGEEAG